MAKTNLPAVRNYDHGENANQQVMAARTEALKEISACFTECQADYRQQCELDMLIINRMRKAGIRLNECAGENHTQLTFNDAGVMFYKAYLAPQLPEDMTIAFAQCAVHLARILPEDITTPEQAKLYKRDVQLCFGTQPEARGPQQLHDAENPLSEIVDRLKKVDADMTDLFKKRPMLEWMDSELDTYMRNARPVVEKYEMAAKIRLGGASRTGELSR